MSPGSLVPAESDPELLCRYTARYREYLEGSFPRWGTHYAASLTRRRANGSLSALLWKGKGGVANGLTLITSARPRAEVHGVWLEPPTPATLGEILDDLEAEIGSPLRIVTDVLPGVGPGAQSLLLRGKGFWHREKVLMRREPLDPVGRRSSPPEVRSIRPADLEAVVGLYARAYSDREGEFWTWSAPGGWTDARHDVMSHLDPGGNWSRTFLSDASFVWESEGRILGAVLVDAERTECPFIEDLIVEPEFHQRGIGRALMEASVGRIAQEGHRTIELDAIRFGVPYRLYQRLGFEEVLPPEGSLDGHWVRGKSPF